MLVLFCLGHGRLSCDDVSISCQKSCSDCWPLHYLHLSIGLQLLLHVPSSFPEYMCYLIWPCPTRCDVNASRYRSRMVEYRITFICHSICSPCLVCTCHLRNACVLWIGHGQLTCDVDESCIFFRSDRWVWNYLKPLLHVHTSFLECMSMGDIHHL